MSNEEKYAELRRLAEAATPGPWTTKFEAYVIPSAHIERSVGGSANAKSDFEDYAHQICTARCKYLTNSDNATYIAAANPATIIALLDELKAKDARIAELEAARFAYASEFAPNADGDPDAGGIHANIRALKHELWCAGVNADGAAERHAEELRAAIATPASPASAPVAPSYMAIQLRQHATTIDFSDGEIGDVMRQAADELDHAYAALYAGVADRVIPTPPAPVAPETVAPHILEALSYHARERDDLTLEDAVEAFRNGYKKVVQRDDRAMLAQIIHLLAATPLPPVVAREVMTEGWQPIETAPQNKGEYLFCQIAWGPEGDQSTGSGLRWQGRWFVAAVFHRLGQDRKYEFRELEVKPTHWMRDVPAPVERHLNGGAK